MTELLASLDYQEVITTIWTVIIVPVLTYAWKQFDSWAKAKKIDKYTNMLKDNVLEAVKDVQATYVDQLKGTEAWTDETKAQALEMAKNKVIYALADSAYKTLTSVNQDFDAYLGVLIEAKLYDLKNNQ